MQFLKIRVCSQFRHLFPIINRLDFIGYFSKRVFFSNLLGVAKVNTFQFEINKINLKQFEKLSVRRCLSDSSSLLCIY